MIDLGRALAEWANAGLTRTTRPARGVDFSSNDYLGLAQHPAVAAALQQALGGERTGGTGSRLLSGSPGAWQALEARFAAWQGAPAALFFSTGYAANVGLLSALLGPDDLVITDQLNHASIIDGIRLARAQKVIVPHLDLNAIESALQSAGRRCWVVVESIYSMDGDGYDLVALFAICERYGARLIVDEAHATGLYGPSGQGRAAAAGVRPFATVHPCGKALGGTGAFVVGSEELRSWLIHRARSFVFSTALPPFVAAGLHAALDIVIAEPERRAKPVALADALRALLPAHKMGSSASQVVPWRVGSASRAVALSDQLACRGWDIRAIRPPTVPEGSSRLRMVLRADLELSQVEQVAHDLLELDPS